MLKTPIARTQRSRTRKVIKTTRKNKDPKGFDDCMSSSSSVVGGGVVDKERNRSGERRNKGRKIVEYESLAKHYNKKKEREKRFIVHSHRRSLRRDLDHLHPFHQSFPPTIFKINQTLTSLAHLNVFFVSPCILCFTLNSPINQSCNRTGLIWPWLKQSARSPISPYDSRRRESRRSSSPNARFTRSRIAGA